MGSVDDYTDKESGTMKRLSSVAGLGRTWDRMDALDCLKKYDSNCDGLDRHRDVILVVEKPHGWTRNEMWQILEPVYDNLGHNSLFWDGLVPANASNHLFYDTACAMSRGVASFDTTYFMSPGSCYNDCALALGWGSTNSSYPFFRIFGTTQIGNKILQPGSDVISVKYCLAEPLESNCYVGLSKILLFSVTLFVVIKTAMALLVTIILRQQGQSPLVTIGDSIASFLEKPDARTVGSAGFGLIKSSVNIGPRRWRVLNSRRSAAIPRSIWIASYLLFAISITICLYFLTNLALQYGSLRKALSGGFFASDTNPFLTRNVSLLTGILTANSPQLLLSASYLAYNNLFTRLQMAREWAMYGTDYYPLRVTDPQVCLKPSYTKYGSRI
ncbi:hypothetical protein SAMD00023353_3200410 [Rosellinia necatrix]|uniref:Uncharacterized protein n=1 Tax=Rosellinia necatrix TaxID=77044 RepID=A0A1S8A9R3_ROSNE|nr:hypothetical protein SAMD00023353_3200410 [Rosellinia necatrix]